MKQTKRLLAVLLSLVMLVCTLPLAVQGADVIDSGVDGNISWSLDSDGTLTISGTGAMNNYSWEYDILTTAPWGEYYNTIKTVVIDDSVTSIGNTAFSGCTALTSVTIPDSVTSIGAVAFDYCISLKNVTIPSSVTSIGKVAFAFCTALEDFSVNVNNEAYASDSMGCLYNKNKTTLIQYPVGNERTTFSIPDSVTSIGDGAFFFCTALTDVTIPDSVTSIGESTFDRCTSLTNVIIPDSVTSIGNDAFSGCTSLTSVIIPDSVTSIGNDAFSGCTSLENATIGDSVESIGDYAFNNCIALESVTIGDSVTSIGYEAFYGCTSLESVTIPDSVTSIGYEAFYGCTALQNVTIPDSVTSIGAAAFKGCTSLTSVTIPNSVMSIGEGAFDGCTALRSVTIGDSVTSIDRYAFRGCTSLTGVTIGDSVTNISEFTFFGCSLLTSVIIPDSVTSIGWYAFYNCISLKDVYYGGSEEDWNMISISSDNTPLESATIHFNWIPGETATDTATGITVTYPDGSYTYTVTLSVTEEANAGNYLVGNYNTIFAWNIKTLVNGVETQPSAPVTVKIPVPDGCDENSIAVYHVADGGEAEKVEPISVKDGYITFSATSFSVYIVVDESSEVVAHTHTPGEAVIENEVKATCQTAGCYDEVTYCTGCGEELSRTSITIDVLNHIDEDNDGKCDACKQQMTGGDHCQQCGKIHNGNLFDKITGFFHRIIYRLTHLFSR